MRDHVIELTQKPYQDSQIEEVIEQLEAVDLALGTAPRPLCANRPVAFDASRNT